MPIQEFEPMDYVGVVIVAIIFAVVLFILSFCCINFCCITKYDDFTKFEKLGAKRNIRLGPHSLRLIKKGGFVEKEEVDALEEYDD